MQSRRVLLVGEPIVDTTARLSLPHRYRTVLRRSDPSVYEKVRTQSVLGGVFYPARFLSHFYDISVVFPKPTGGEKTVDSLLEDLKQRRIILHGVSVDRKVYEITRFLQTQDLKIVLPGFPVMGSLISGDIDYFEGARLDDLAKEIEDVLKSDNFDCMLLADYDLGLFTHAFVRRIAKIMRDRNPNLPVIVYAGQRWRKYASLRNCRIFAESSEATEDLSDILEIDGVDTRNRALADPLRYIASRFPRLNGFTLVDGEQTRLAEWKLDIGAHKIGGRVLLRKSWGTTFTPIGHRALIASYIGLKLVEGADLTDSLVKAHEAARYNIAILTDEFTADDAEAIRSDETGESELEEQAHQSSELIISMPELLLQQILQDNLEVRIGNAITEVPGYYSCCTSLKVALSNLMRRLREKELDRFSPVPNLALQKILLHGPSGSGKTSLAKAIATDYLRARNFPIESIDNFVIQCNDVGLPDSSADITRRIMADMTKHCSTAGIAILDEIGFIKGGTEVQRQLKEPFGKSDRSILPRRHDEGVVILTLSAEDPSLKELPKDNLHDFFNRFPDTCRLYLPPLDKRILDTIYIFCGRLHENGVSCASLGGIIAFAEQGYTQAHEIIAKADRLASKQTDEIGDREFAQEGLAAETEVDPGRLVSIIRVNRIERRNRAKKLG